LQLVELGKGFSIKLGQLFYKNILANKTTNFMARIHYEKKNRELRLNTS